MLGYWSLANRLMQVPFWVFQALWRVSYPTMARLRALGETVPTLNLRTEAQVIPARGVYVTRTSEFDSTRQWTSVTNIGYRPTFGNNEELTIETFLLDPLDGATPERIRLEFLRRVRDEKKFESPAQRRRLSMKPGLTCLWQVSGRNEVKSFDEWVRLDLEYIDNWSLWLDLKILLRTLPVVLMGSGAR